MTGVVCTWSVVVHHKKLLYNLNGGSTSWMMVVQFGRQQDITDVVVQLGRRLRWPSGEVWSWSCISQTHYYVCHGLPLYVCPSLEVDGNNSAQAVQPFVFDPKGYDHSGHLNYGVTMLSSYWFPKICGDSSYLCWPTRWRKSLISHLLIEWNLV